MQPDAETILLLKQRKLQLARQKLEAVKNDGLHFYKPHPKQDSFHRSGARYRGVFTGNRWGKSTCGCAEDCAWARGERVWYPESDPARRAGIPQHPTKGCITVVDWEKAQEIWTGDTGKLWKFLPKDGFIKKIKRNSSGAVNYIQCANDSTIRIETVKSFKSDALSVESSDWDWLHYDEPCPEAMFKGMFRGATDRGGRAWFTLTALSEPWITDAFEPNGLFEGRSFVVEGSIYDNIYLTRENIQEFESTLTEDEKSCRIYGKPLHKAGLIYKEFQRDIHLLETLPKGWQSWVEPPKDWSYYLYIDPHAAVPIAVLFLTVDPFGRLYFYHDIFTKQLISSCCAQINSILGTRKLVRARMDPCGFIEDPINQTTWADEFAKAGIYCEKASKDLERGILRTQAALTQRPTGIYFTPSCRRTVWEIQRYHWIPEENRPVDKDDHMMENLRRAILDEPVYIRQNQFAPVLDETFERLPSLELGPIDFGINETENHNLIPLN